MFERKITRKRMHEIADEMKDELATEIHRAIVDRQNSDDEQEIDNLYSYQHALEHSLMNINTLVHRLDIATNK